MPSALPQRRPRGLTRWHFIGLLVGYVVVMIVIVWVAVERASPPAQPITTGIAPADQSGKPLSR